jgi:Tfp pilus assembly protein PilN
MRPVNLIPAEQRRQAPDGATGRRGYALVGVLALLLVMVVVYVLSSNQVTERRNEAATVRAEADELEAEAARRGNYTDFAEVARTRLAAVAAVAETRFDWERFMRELSRIVPAGSWLQSTDASVSGDLVAGEVPSSTTTTTAAAPAGPSANLVGCTPDQDDVAAMMVRLRNLHRVADVTLNESAREQATNTPAAIDNCGSLYKFDIRVGFDPVPPAREKPRGADGVPASLGGGS